MTLFAGSIHENLVCWVSRMETLQPSNEEVFHIAGEAQIRNVHENSSQGLQHTINDDPNPHSKAIMIGLMTGLTFFEEAGNGSVYALLPHVHTTSNGKSLPLRRPQDSRGIDKVELLRSRSHDRSYRCYRRSWRYSVHLDRKIQWQGLC